MKKSNNLRGNYLKRLTDPEEIKNMKIRLFVTLRLIYNCNSQILLQLLFCCMVQVIEKFPSYVQNCTNLHLHQIWDQTQERGNVKFTLH